MAKPRKRRRPRWEIENDKCVREYSKALRTGRFDLWRAQYPDYPFSAPFSTRELKRWNAHAKKIGSQKIADRIIRRILDTAKQGRAS